MTEYIEREAVLAEAQEVYHWCGHENRYSDFVPVEAICGIPAADVQPVVYGRWIWNEECECWVCSNCELSALNNYRGNSTDSNYCPNCGAKMVGEE